MDRAAFLFETSWGWCAGLASGIGIVGLLLPCRSKRPLEQHAQEIWKKASWTIAPDTPQKRIADATARQVLEYLDGKRQTFDLAIDWPATTAFRRRIWEILRTIPYGTTVEYGRLASLADRPRAARAVGGAVGANPLGLIVPCHRVVGAAGYLGGFSAVEGVSLKRRLLEFESGNRQ
jgi:methylated-DNA-[protein]-cysteine S-methyltransferase